MKRSFLSLLALLAAVALVIVQSSNAQEEAAGDNAEARADYQGPLPYYFGKLGIEDDQREQLYAIDDEYEAKIEELEKQIQALKDERDARMETLLTPGQKLRLKELREAAAKREALEKAKAQAVKNAPSEPSASE